ncbi:hypothetical protein STEG23_027858 [Scotinomys teguina]
MEPEKILSEETQIHKHKHDQSQNTARRGPAAVGATGVPPGRRLVRDREAAWGWTDGTRGKPTESHRPTTPGAVPPCLRHRATQIANGPPEPGKTPVSPKPDATDASSSLIG